MISSGFTKVPMPAKYLDETKYELDKVLEGKHVPVKIAAILRDMMEKTAAALERQGKQVIFRVNDRGVTGFCGDPSANAAFVFLTPSQEHMTAKYYLHGETVLGLRNGYWINANDNLGSELLVIDDVKDIESAVQLACRAYDIRNKHSAK